VRMLRGLEGEPGMPRVHVTFLAAHAVPPEFFGRRADYIDAVSSWCADASAVGADSVDVYCEEGRFTEDEARWILSAGRRSGLLPRLHACGSSRTGAGAAGQGRGGRARLGPLAGRDRYHLDGAGDLAGGVLPRDDRGRGAAGG